MNLQPALLPRTESSQHASQGPLPATTDNHEGAVSLGKAILSSEQAKIGLKAMVSMPSPCRPDSSTSKRPVIKDQRPTRDWLNRGIRISEPNQQVFTGPNSWNQNPTNLENTPLTPTQSPNTGTKAQILKAHDESNVNTESAHHDQCMDVCCFGKKPFTRAQHARFFGVNTPTVDTPIQTQVTFLSFEILSTSQNNMHPVQKSKSIPNPTTASKRPANPIESEDEPISKTYRVGANKKRKNC